MLHKPHPDKTIEAMAETIYLEQCAVHGGKWQYVETPESWWKLAEERLSAPNHADREHSELSASSSYRWLNCPGSVAAIRGVPNPTTAAAEEGTAAHELANLCLVNRQDAIEYIGRVVHDHTVDEEMADGVQVYLDEVRNTWDGNTLSDTRWVEQRFTLASLDPPAPMFGTADSVCFITGHGTLFVHDLKYGKGHRVEATDNPQLRYYALGALLKLQETHPHWQVSKIVATIVQPRQPAAGKDPVRSTEIDPIELMYWAYDLIDKAKAAMEPNAPFVAGPWCDDSFCPLRGPRCPAATSYALEAARLDFADVLAPGAKAEAPALVTLTPDELGVLLTRLDALEAWCTDARSLAFTELQAGRAVPGWKLVAKEGRDAWSNATDTEGALSTYLENPFAEPKLLSPAQARTRLKDAIHSSRGGTKKAAEAAARDLLRPLISRPVGAAIAPANDPRPALEAGPGLTALPDETN